MQPLRSRELKGCLHLMLITQSQHLKLSPNKILFKLPDPAYTVNVYECPLMNVHGAVVQLLTPIETPVAGLGPVAVYTYINNDF